MSPTTILEPTTHKPWRPRQLLQNNIVVLGVISLLALLGMLVAREAPLHERSLTITNPSVYELSVEVAGTDSGWLPINTVDRETTATTDNVFDQGDTWRIRFTGQGREAGIMVISRNDLQNAGWHLTVPADIGDQLAASGATESPKH